MWAPSSSQHLPGARLPEELQAAYQKEVKPAKTV